MKYQFTILTTSTSPLASTPSTSTYKTNTSNISTIAGSVIPVLVVFPLVLLVVLFWKKKRQFGMTFFIVLISKEYLLFYVLRILKNQNVCLSVKKIDNWILLIILTGVE